jgi:hypothetical protein
MVAQPTDHGSLLPFVAPGMAVYDTLNERLGKVTRILAQGLIQVETERWKHEHYYIRPDQLASVGFARIRLSVRGVDLLRC